MPAILIRATSGRPEIKWGAVPNLGMAGGILRTPWAWQQKGPDEKAPAGSAGDHQMQ